MPVGELFLGAFLQVLFDRLATGLVLAFARQERIYKLLEKWNQKLSIILAFIADAEDKQLTDESVKLWLQQLRDLAYDLDDVLDVIATEALIQKSEGVQEKPGKLCKFIPSCKDFTPGAFMFKKRMKSRIQEILVRLEDIATTGNTLNLSQKIAGPSNHGIDRSTTSIVEPHVYGRDKDKEAVSKLMAGNQESVSIIPIVGMGGIGKTTLAQLIYNDEVMGAGFDLKTWVCVSDFDVFTVTKTIFHSVTQDSPESKDLNMLQVSLQEKFSNSKFLLVLDDVWNEDYTKWDALRRPFLVGLPGSKVLVTTRNEGIARMVGSVPCYSLNLLDDKDCLSLLAQHALGKSNFEADLNFKSIGQALSEKCKGLPLAAKTLGGILKSKRSPAEWEEVLHSKIWDLREQNNILPVLRLSYHYLPSNLKQLFAYCSIFPKDYQFDKYELVLLWMGEGFLSESGEMKTKEQFGFDCFENLVSRSFFQQLSSHDSHFVMHDLINDLAQFVVGGMCYKLDEKVETSDEYKIPKEARHASFLRHEYEVFRKFNGFYHAKGLRTFIPMPVQNIHVWPPFYLSSRILHELLPELPSLRVLSLSGYCITELPGSICKLIHLRYLNLSGTSIKLLPDSLSNLYNLETLSIRNCRFICKLPSTVGNLVNLRHLDNSNTDQLKDLPVEIGKLGNLQSLPKIALSEAGGLRLRELGNLHHLCGVVALLELQNVISIDDAKEARMSCKKEIEELQFSWRNDLGVARDCRFEQNVLDSLQPHQNLRKLKIEFYRGMQFPTWIGDPSFSKLFNVILTGCTECSSLPPLGLMPELKHLHIEDMPRIKNIGIGFFTKIGGNLTFPKLETLRFNRMLEWEEWTCSPDECQIHFPSLRQLTIFKCPKLARVSPLSLPVLHELDLVECSLAVIESLRDLSSLNYLKVESIAGLSHLPNELVQSMAAVEVLECSNSSELRSLWSNGVTLQHLSRLRRLVVADCSIFASLGDEEPQLPCNIEILELLRCANLTSLPNNLKGLMSFRELIIKQCPKITNFPEHGIPPLLKRLEILNCKALESLPSDMSSLERLEIKECPSLRKWSVGSFPNELKKLSIKNCSNLEPVSEEMFPPDRIISLEELSTWDWMNFSTLLRHVYNFSLLTELHISHCRGLKYFPEQGLPRCLKTLSVEHCSNLKALPEQMKKMPSIISLEIHSCRKLKKFPRFDFPPNLSSLRIWDSRKLKPLSEWGLHRLPYLREFSICGGFPDLQILSSDPILPPSLIRVSIARFPKLSSLARVLDNLTCLQHLSIVNCTNLNVLPGEHLLEKLWRLEISDCPLLKPRCLKNGDYWPKIAGIPCVDLDVTHS